MPSSRTAIQCLMEILTWPILTTIQCIFIEMLKCCHNTKHFSGNKCLPEDSIHHQKDANSAVKREKIDFPLCTKFCANKKNVFASPLLPKHCHAYDFRIYVKKNVFDSHVLSNSGNTNFCPRKRFDSPLLSKCCHTSWKSTH